MTDSELNDMRLCKGIKAEAYSDCTRFVIQKDGTIKRKAKYSITYWNQKI